MSEKIYEFKVGADYDDYHYRNAITGECPHCDSDIKHHLTNGHLFEDSKEEEYEIICPHCDKKILLNLEVEIGITDIYATLLESE